MRHENRSQFVMNRTCPLMALILPCYNEEEILPSTLETVSTVISTLKSKGKISELSFALYVDDGSVDNTWTLIEKFTEIDDCCRGLKLAGNFGHQNAILAGMLEVSPYVDCLVTMDADLQDDISTVEEMLQFYSGGCDIVYGVRNDRTSDTIFNRVLAGLFYSLMLKLGVKLVPQHSDFRLVGRNVLENIERYPEKNVFLRGIFPSMGFRHAKVFYARLPRARGVTKYPFLKLLSLAWQGITSFSSQPLRWVSIVSLAAMFFSLIYGLYILYVRLKGVTVPGWTTLAAGMFFLGAVQLLSIAILGEYIAKIFIEVKNRPRYIKETQTWNTTQGAVNERRQK